MYKIFFLKKTIYYKTNDMKKNTVKLTEAKLNQVIRESIKNYIKENEEIDWGGAFISAGIGAGPSPAHSRYMP